MQKIILSIFLFSNMFAFGTYFHSAPFAQISKVDIAQNATKRPDPESVDPNAQTDSCESSKPAFTLDDAPSRNEIIGLRIAQAACLVISGFCAALACYNKISKLCLGISPKKDVPLIVKTISTGIAVASSIAAYKLDKKAEHDQEKRDTILNAIIEQQKAREATQA